MLHASVTIGETVLRIILLTLLATPATIYFVHLSHIWGSRLGGGGWGRGLEFSNQLKFSPLFSFFKLFAYSLKIILYSLKCWLIFASSYMTQWRKSCLKPGFKVGFVFHDRNAKAKTSTQSEYTVNITCSRNNAIEQCNTMEMKWVLELQPFIPNANRLNIWQLYNLRHQLKGKAFYPNQHPAAGQVVRKWLVVM